MASGFGAFGGIGRCYPFWMSFKECMRENDEKLVCKPHQEDYMECLHHNKEFARMNKIEEHRRHAEARENGDGGGGH
eukprot:CAMPEP_0198656508 /NCGR_PEP_ID=MMETSP1467-20131203/9929_1 /TAXON_ID=1462469 /ORGANISM="unid. sp., Strain CCMP2135" /LENGTH=76 /DNA_ID=CAMNT_0044392551 /DNA_START=50 /DNA_END=280 /DNA_ORIENTATION=+